MSRVKSSWGRGVWCSASVRKERQKEIDLGLAVMCALLQPGECVSHTTIAEVTGMSHGGAFMIEKRALRKLQFKLRAEKREFYR